MGCVITADASYIGGIEHTSGSEYWWLRISPEGRRTTITEPRTSRRISDLMRTTITTTTSNNNNNTTTTTRLSNNKYDDELDGVIVSNSSNNKSCRLHANLSVVGDNNTDTNQLLSSAAVSLTTAEEDVFLIDDVDIIDDPRMYLLTEGKNIVIKLV